MHVTSRWHSGTICTQEKFPRIEHFPKISLLKVENFQFFSDGKFVSANHILQNFLFAENFSEWNGP